jgi:hypothetical protein
MNIKDGILLVLASLVFGWLILDGYPSNQPNKVIIDTTKRVVTQINNQQINSQKAITQINNQQAITQAIIKPQDTIVSVRGKKALFIGDSHTANHSYGWQIQVCQATGLQQNNIAVGGKTTSWMLQQANMYLTPNYDYCFIYGGANDMYNSHISAYSAYSNIQAIVNMCNFKGVKPVVLTGFDYSVCTRTENRMYPVKGAELQRMLLTQLRGAQVVDTRVVYRGDCGDALCHMSYSGHQKTAKAVISACKFKVY